jgi:hypothetical protein
MDRREDTIVNEAIFSTVPLTQSLLISCGMLTKGQTIVTRTYTNSFWKLW